MSDLIRDRRYNDRDVRDNPDLHAVAVRYLEQYTGEFDFLVDMRIRALDEDYGLTVGMVRGVLNCMRNDPRVRGLPEPGPQKTEEDTVVTSLDDRRPRRRPASPEVREKPPCPQAATEHDSHFYLDPDDSNSQWHCLGWHALTRDFTDTNLRVNVGYVRGRQSNLVHRATGEGGATWMPGHFHREGGMHRVIDWWAGVCCTVYSLKSPVLLDAPGVRTATPYLTPTGTVYGKYPDVTLCSRCFPGGDTTIHTR